MNPIDNWYVMVLEVTQRENVRTSLRFKTALFFWTSLLSNHGHILFLSYLFSSLSRVLVCSFILYFLFLILIFLVSRGL